MRIKIFLSLVLVAVISIFTMIVVARQSTAREVRAFMVGAGMVDTGTLIDDLQAFYASNQSWQGVENLFASPGHGMMMGRMMNQQLTLSDAQGNILYDTVGTPGRLNQASLEDATRLVYRGELVGYLLAAGGFGVGRQQETNLLARLTQAALYAALLAIALALGLSAWLSFRLLRPISQLTQAAEKLSQGDLSQNVPVQGRDEIARLGMAFNDMAASLNRSETARRAMTADIAHELRNPLAVQRANLEALQDGVYPLTAENLEPLNEQNRLLTRLVDDLATLALADAQQLRLDVAPADISALTRNVLVRFDSQARAQDVTLVFTEPPSSDPGGWIIPLDAQRIEQILNNLISNALRFTPAGGEIRLSLRRSAGQIVLSVKDSGPGIPADSLPYVFERFYRADRARSREDGGSGLGLAIARKLAEAHRGSLTAHNAASGGAEFVLRLPVNPA
jgi:signal transduction histidine kinase